MENRARPSDVILDLTRGAGSAGRSARYLVEAGALFGFAENTIRVTLSRLQNKGLLESPERGRYRLTATADPVNAFVERWRMGEGRVRGWTAGRWLLVYATDLSSRSLWALEALGFRQVRSDLFARPDNLAMTLPELQRTAADLGLEGDALFIATDTARAAQAGPDEWIDRWHCQAIDQGYRRMTDQLAQSARRLARIDPMDARLECFKLGGAGIHMLAKDPMLPAEFVDVAARARLWQSMLEYDAQGKQIWADRRSGHINHFPVARAAEFRA